MAVTRRASAANRTSGPGGMDRPWTAYADRVRFVATARRSAVLEPVDGPQRLLNGAPACILSRCITITRMELMRRRNPTREYARLTQPLVREHGTLRPATWDEALDRAADGFRRNLAAHGANATGIFSCSKSTNEVNYLAQKLARAAFGNNNIDSCNRT